MDNGQLGVALALAKGRDVCLIDKELYLPHEWAEDPSAVSEPRFPKRIKVTAPPRKLPGT